MTGITAFPTITQVCDQGHDKARAYKAGAAIKAGQVVAFALTGVTDTVHPAKKGVTGTVAGVALTDIASGSWGTVLKNGAIVYVANADDTTGIDAGAFVECNDNAVGGTVSAASQEVTSAGELTGTVVGIAQEDIAGGATGRIEISIQYGPTGSSS
ncbi:hypothetical protein [Methanoregula sp.]|jgi:predicted RecA/RadA family phage recombinase|uniref:hypothetical protein n=1 Tax=Methanoregula sp. TaxID=2052170 RepID=UPI0035686586